MIFISFERPILPSYRPCYIPMFNHRGTQADVSESGTNRTLVLAIGNLLMTDEGAGIHTLNHLIARNADDPDLSAATIEYIDGGTLSFTIAAHIEDADNLVVIDAAELNSEPGTVQVFEGEDMLNQLGSCRLSVHEIGLVDLMDIVRLNERMPARFALVGIQPLTVADWGDRPSEPVAAAIPRASAAVNELLREWHRVH